MSFEEYESPTCEVVRMVSEMVIAGSPSFNDDGEYTL